MCICGALSCALLCHLSPNDPFSENKTHTRTRRHIGSDSYLTPYCGTPSSVVNTAHLHSKGDIQAFPVTENLEDAQQPPSDVFNYWIHQLEVPFDATLAQTPSSLPTLSSVFGGVLPPAPLLTSDPRNVAPEIPLAPPAKLQAPLELLFSFPDHASEARHRPWVIRRRHTSRHRVYDRPGNKPAVEYEPDSMELQAACRRRGGADFACQWISRVFKDGVTLEALVRRLKLTEIEGMNFPGGFQPSLAYDGFLQKADEGFECCLCPFDKRTWWKNKKDAVRHLRKFHFGLADRCGTCRNCFYSTGEMTSHRCVPLKNRATSTTT